MVDLAIPFLFSLGLSLLLTAVVRRIAPQFGLIAQPRADRWHRQPVALMGGIAIYLSFLVTLLLFTPWGEWQRFGGLLVGGSMLFLCGLLDDVRGVKPHEKLVCQIMAGCLAFFWVKQFPNLPAIITVPLSLLWLVGITNAFNLLDNMDGLAGGVAIICAAFLALIALRHGSPALPAAALILAGATLGFLVFNFHPAKIFMGDCGSLFLGYTLALLCLESFSRLGTHLVAAIAVPALVVSVPIFDTTLVTLTRLAQRRSIAQGGKDHSSHRLVYLGLSERRAVLYLYAFSALSGFIAFSISGWRTVPLLVLLLLLLAFFALVGIFLASVRLTHSPEEARVGIVLTRNILYKSQMLQMALDLIFICLAFLAAYLLRVDGNLSPDDVTRIIQALPVLITFNLGAFLLSGLYKNMWEYSGSFEVLRIAKAVSVGSLGALAALFMLWRLEGYPRSVFVLEWMILFLLGCSSRFGSRLLYEHFLTYRQSGKRALIYGAGANGSLLLRYLRSNHNGDYTIVGFVDDDETKQGKVINGVKVLGKGVDLPAIARSTQAEEVLVALPNAAAHQINQIVEQCSHIGIPCQLMQPLLHAA